jgi:hypothetical protein
MLSKFRGERQIASAEEAMNIFQTGRHVMPRMEIGDTVTALVAFMRSPSTPPNVISNIMPTIIKQMGSSEYGIDTAIYGGAIAIANAVPNMDARAAEELIAISVKVMQKFIQRPLEKVEGTSYFTQMHEELIDRVKFACGVLLLGKSSTVQNAVEMAVKEAGKISADMTKMKLQAKDAEINSLRNTLRTVEQAFPDVNVHDSTSFDLVKTRISQARKWYEEAQMHKKNIDDMRSNYTKMQEEVTMLNATMEAKEGLLRDQVKELQSINAQLESRVNSLNVENARCGAVIGELKKRTTIDTMNQAGNVAEGTLGSFLALLRDTIVGRIGSKKGVKRYVIDQIVANLSAICQSIVWTEAEDISIHAMIRRMVTDAMYATVTKGYDAQKRASKKEFDDEREMYVPPEMESVYQDVDEMEQSLIERKMMGEK